MAENTARAIYPTKPSKSVSFSLLGYRSLRLGDEVLRRVALRSQASQAQGRITFGQPASIVIQQKRTMKEGRRLSLKRSIDQDLPYGRGEKVRSADNFGDPHRQIINDNSKLVGRYVISIPDKKIPEIARGHAGDGAVVSIVKRDRLSVRNAKSPVGAAWFQEVHPLPDGCSPFDRKDGLFLMRSESCLRHIPSGAQAGINATSIAQFAPGVQVELASLALISGTLVPFDSQPFEVCDGGLGIAGPAALRIEIVNA